MTFLLDINVLIALIDPDHVDHQTAHRWFETNGSDGWATCPIVENGTIRILGSPSYPLGGVASSTAEIAALLHDLRTMPGHLYLA